MTAPVLLRTSVELIPEGWVAVAGLISVDTSHVKLAMLGGVAGASHGDTGGAGVIGTVPFEV